MKLIQGDTLTASVTLRNSDLTPINLTGATVTFTITTPTVYSQPITITNATGGICQLTVPASVTNTWKPATYCYELQILGSSGDITTTPTQQITILKQLTPNA